MWSLNPNLFDETELTKKSTDRLESIVGHTQRFRFVFNRREKRFEFWERRGPYYNMVFPITVNEKPLKDITDWEMKHAVQFVKKKRAQEEADRIAFEKKMQEQKKIAEES